MYNDKNYSMFRCAQNNDLLGVIKCVELLKSNINYIHVDAGRTALFWAIFHKNMAMIDFLLNQGADLRHKDDFKRSYFQLACDVHNIKAAKFFLKKGFNINAVNIYG